MATVSLLPSSATTITISLASLGSSATFVGGRESNEIDNTSDLYVDALVSGVIRVGTTPAANTVINLYLWGNHVSLATTPLDVLDGTDSAETITSAGVLASGLVLAHSLIVDATTSDRDYFIKPFGVARYFDYNMPRFWGLYVAQNTGANLNATGGQHILRYVGYKYTIA